MGPVKADTFTLVFKSVVPQCWGSFHFVKHYFSPLHFRGTCCSTINKIWLLCGGTYCISERWTFQGTCFVSPHSTFWTLFKSLSRVNPRFVLLQIINCTFYYPYALCRDWLSHCGHVVVCHLAVICSSSMRWQLSTKISPANIPLFLSASELRGDSTAFNFHGFIPPQAPDDRRWWWNGMLLPCQT